MTLILSLLLIFPTFASEIPENIPPEILPESPELLEETDIPEPISEENDITVTEDVHAKMISQASVWEEIVIDLTQLSEKLRFQFPQVRIDFLWLPENASTQYGPVFRRSFGEKGIKKITLKIYYTSEDTGFQRELFWETFEILIYDRSFLLLYSDEIIPSDVELYRQDARKDGIYLYRVGPISPSQLEVGNMINEINAYKQTSGFQSDYVILWGGRDFIFNTLSNISVNLPQGGTQKNEFHIVGMSAYHLPVLWRFLANFLANKDWIVTFLLLEENGKNFLLKHNQISELQQELTKNEQPFLDIDITSQEVKNIYFLSRFVSILSSRGYSTQDIFLLLVMPIVLTIIVFFRHIIGWGTMGIMIPLFLALLFLKWWLLTTGIFLWYFCVINICLMLVSSRVTLLYWPKIVFFVTIQMIFFVVMFNILSIQHIMNISASDMIFSFLFLILNTRIIEIMTSKDLSEYRASMTYTLVIPLVSFGFLQTNTIKILLLSYPELILLTLPVTLFLWRYSWLRLTEYIRFLPIIREKQEHE